MPADLREALDALERAMGPRPFILVYDLAPPNAEVSHLRCHEHPAQPAYVTIGLLRAAAALYENGLTFKEPSRAPAQPFGTRDTGHEFSIAAGAAGIPRCVRCGMTPTEAAVSQANCEGRPDLLRP